MNPSATPDEKDWCKKYKQKAEDLYYLSLERAEMIDKVCRYIFLKQQQFFLTGSRADIVSISQNEIAKYIDRHRSMVSRLLKNKSIETPYGVFPLKWLASAGNINKEEMLRDAIQREDKKNPLTDSQLAEIIKEKTGKKRFGRTAVTNLRKKLGIPKRSERKQRNDTRNRF